QRAGEIPRRCENRPDPRRAHHRPVRGRADRGSGGGDGVPRLVRRHRHDLSRASLARRGDERRGACGRQTRAQHLSAAVPKVDHKLDARAAGVAILVMAILGGSYTAGKVAVHDLPVFGTLELRMLITTVMLGAYAWWAGVPL